MLYRDAYFINRIGFAVRDTQFVETIRRSDYFDKVTIINRPVFLLERIVKPKRHSGVEGFHIVDTTSYRLFPFFSGRRSLLNVYNEILSKTLAESREHFDVSVVVDFHPISMLRVEDRERLIFWYDQIDNFAKHNRFSRSERELVRQKTQYVANHYDVISSVSSQAGEVFSRADVFVAPNGVFSSGPDVLDAVEPTFDFGFIGFITDKIDIEYLSELRRRGFSVVLYGKSFSRATLSSLTDAGVDYMGSFQYRDVSKIIRTFSVGLIPYLAERSHDGSPLKMYEYLRNRRPCLTSIDYELRTPWITNYRDANPSDGDLRELLRESGNPAIASSIPEDAYYERRLEPIMDRIGKLSAKIARGPAATRE